AGGVHPPGFYRELWGALTTNGRWQGEICNRRKNGELFVEWLSIKRLHDKEGNVTHHVAVFSDVTEHRVETDRIRRLAHYDLLTGLPNRALFADRARQALAMAKRDKTELAVMFLDLDRFKEVNDTLGHAVGDLLLKAAAARMQDCLRASDTVARIGGDEFVVLLPTIETAENAMAVAQKMRHALLRPFELAGRSLRVTCSVGVAVHPGHGDDEKQLLRNADIAMYRAKKGGRDSVEFYRQEVVESVV
ncbi:MAG: diguanylate cyclase, partial [Burkholderiales bacterium]|nr:diguanylate cyclase [Burkholderiales bacterium]